MKARIFCHDSPDFPGHGHHGHHGNSTHTVSSDIPSSTLIDAQYHHPHPHKQWQHCEIVPEIPFNGPLGKKDLIGAAFFGLILGLILCAIPLFVLLRKVRRMKMKRGGMYMHHGGHHGGRHGGGGRWKLKEHGGPNTFPEYGSETEHLLKAEYEAPTVNLP
ncbi:hypothetical protein B0H11DRAFT_2241601 [Mycena galericulata]|nr:hypothetical protein B0H11DRAFT_2241601 [Mycena galericulata]